MKSSRAFSFRLTDLLVLAFELNLALAGVFMIVASVRGNTSGIYLPAEAIVGMLPAILVVGFAAWMVYRMRCVSRAVNRWQGLLAAGGLGIVAISFGAAVGKLSMVFSTDMFELAVSDISHDPLAREAGLCGLLTFTLIGFVFGSAFVLRAGKATPAPVMGAESLHSRLQQLGQRVVHNWNAQLVSRVDELVRNERHEAAARLYQSETGCPAEQAAQIIDDWPEQRLQLELELLERSLDPTPSLAIPNASSVSLS